MADETNTSAEAGPQLSVQKIYLKDVSFEAPAAPAIFQEQMQPRVDMNLTQKVANIGENVFEVVLAVTVTCKVGEKTAYLCEVQQAGIFGAAGFEPQQLDAVLGTYCPHVLFPYLRQVISDLIQNGGFPPLYLQPINFEQVYAEAVQQRAAQAAPKAVN
jgi:preprotein translocase subunit SecB